MSMEIPDHIIERAAKAIHPNHTQGYCVQCYSMAEDALTACLPDLRAWIATEYEQVGWWAFGEFCDDVDLDWFANHPEVYATPCLIRREGVEMTPREEIDAIKARADAAEAEVERLRKITDHCTRVMMQRDAAEARADQLAEALRTVQHKVAQSVGYTETMLRRRLNEIDATARAALAVPQQETPTK